MALREISGNVRTDNCENIAELKKYRRELGKNLKEVELRIQQRLGRLSGDASFSSDNFAASSGAITIKDGGVALAEIADAAANTVIVRDANSSGVLSAKAVTNTQILIGDGTGFTAAALSGDVTMTNAGAVTIANDAVETAMIADDAITEAKMADDAISSAELKSLVTINILASDGSTVVKTIFTPGS